MNAPIATATRWRRSLERLIRRRVCQHNWTLHSRDRYAVMRGDGSKEGEVTLTLMECSKCGKDWLIPSDRTHSPNAQAQTPPT